MNENSKEIKDKIVIAPDAEGITVKEFKGLPEEERRKALKDLMQPVFEMLQNQDFKELLNDAEMREKVLTPYIEKVLTDKNNKHKYKGITAAQVLENLDVMGRVIDPDALTAEILKRAEKRKRAEAAHNLQKKKQDENQAEERAGAAIRYIKSNTLQTTATKIANEFYSFAPPVNEIAGQLTLNTVYASKAGKDIAVYSYFNFNEGELKQSGITRRNFTDYDYFVAMVCNNLYLEGNRKVSLTKIWHEMGNPKSPNPKQLQELREALILSATTIMHISNKEVLDLYEVETKSYEDIVSPVIPAQIKTEYSRVNGYYLRFFHTFKTSQTL